MKEYVKKMKELQDHPDTEIAHIEADEILCEVLKMLGCDELVDEVECNPYKEKDLRCPLKIDTSVTLSDYEKELNKKGKTCFVE